MLSPGVSIWAEGQAGRVCRQRNFQAVYIQRGSFVRLCAGHPPTRRDDNLPLEWDAVPGQEEQLLVPVPVLTSEAMSGPWPFPARTAWRHRAHPVLERWAPARFCPRLSKARRVAGVGMIEKTIGLAGITAAVLLALASAVKAQDSLSTA